MIVKLLTEHHLEFLSLKGSCRGWTEIHMSICQCHSSCNILYVSCAARLLSHEFFRHLKHSASAKCDFAAKYVKKVAVEVHNVLLGCGAVAPIIFKILEHFPFFLCMVLTSINCCSLNYNKECLF